MAGRLAPFIELGVGFNPELTARENVALNGVMMGLGRREAAGRLERVLEFAGLREFVDLKLKNYSSGMMVRLAFSVMVEADADIMLIDEVLAVGDAAFAQKCLDVFREKRRAGKTVVLVTHDMATVQGFCDRAMVLHDGEMQYVGDPEEAALRYFRLNFEDTDDVAAHADGVRVVDTWLAGEDGGRLTDRPHGAPLRVNVVVEAHEELPRPIFAFQCLNGDGVPVFGFSRSLAGEDDDEDFRIPAGGRARLSGAIENPLVGGRYTISCSVCRDGNLRDVALKVPSLLSFSVAPSNPAPVAIGDYEVGMVSVDVDVDATIDEGIR
jgi:energy-coupling factor transporter ATP-binding protein EcfA2